MISLTLYTKLASRHIKIQQSIVTKFRAIVIIANILLFIGSILPLVACVDHNWQDTSLIINIALGNASSFTAGGARAYYQSPIAIA